ncbi:TMEM165/GDT1 family protein [Halorarius litoreus]|uniref:TMEM165/GDT1 family protein n=1 Tax=Halorarius litoreus TaxID=2962676 RepID=UPI0020CCC2DF|nr:TMEM165/GDT1 family protein [Halorarius litoreus]
MATWLEVATIAFVAQLTVLPGEKVQFIIAGLSTRYHPGLVVAAAGSAFAGWTALEVLVGNALQRALPGRYLDVFTGALFLLFAVLLWRSAPTASTAGAATDGGVVQQSAPEEMSVTLPFTDREVPTVAGGFLPIFALMAAGEFGDKTQLVTIGLAAQYAHGTAIWAGEMAAIIPVSLLNALFFFRFSHRFDRRTAHLAGAVLFTLFGLDTLQATLTGVSVWETLVGWLATAGASVAAGLLALG